ncbi:hypothetical protein P152DRAFT_308386 [Eremomyces bilateralis CBS 781.70]|uniref:ARM repeat-containing protein n=1 Tax=Eremomyces bilateralis CBS 781.70 TaxID=1392243 RepID=A0A6G1G564_9PEZI|nr:uncharacterized protein P152DRAFT_308386 [Eremomyces bilateralis CBS 781.70]KAF1813194.1 hypothetical protein P152DRAFT_308386 [Eremomyces bilateralis CBS 781.70]
MSPSVWKDVQVLLAHPDSIFRRMVKQAQLGDDEARPYFNLFLTVAEQSVQEMLREPETDFHGYLLEVMKESLSASDWPVEPSHPAILALQFWQNFIDEMSDALMADESPSEFPQSRIVWWNSARLNLLAAIEKFMIRLRLPSLSELHDWGKDERDVFREFRRDVKDLFSEAYSIIGNDILVGFVRFTASALESSSPDPLQIEASLTSFSAIGDAINESDETDQAVATIVGSRLFQFLSSPELPYLVKKSGIDLIASMTSFYQRRPDLVPLALNFLFEAAKHESLAVSASRSISQLTSACRSELTSELSTFFVKYDEFIAGPTIDSLTKEKLIGSIAAVVQAIPVHEDRLSALETLLRYVSKDIERSIELMNLAQRPGHPESARESLQAGEQAMRCLAAIARSFEDDGTQVVDLENSEGGGPMSTEREKILQLQISRMISTQLSLFGDHATFEVVESACSVFRTGFKGRDGGPFSLPAADFLALLFQRSIHSPGFSDEWLKSLCTYLSAASLQKSQQKESDMNDILEYLLNLVTVQLQNDPGQDPDATVGIVQCLSKFFRSNLAFFSRLRVDCRPILHFAARSLETREILPRRAAAEFWVGAFYEHLFLGRLNDPLTQCRNSSSNTRISPLKSSHCWIACLTRSTASSPLRSYHRLPCIVPKAS